MNKLEKKLWFKKNKGKIIKKGTIALSVLILIVGVIYISYSKFDSKVEFTLINGKVNYQDGDAVFAIVSEDTNKLKEMPSKEDGYFYLSSSCNNDATINFNEETWSDFSVSNFTKSGTKCTIYFAKPTVKYYLDDVEVSEEEIEGKYLNPLADNSCSNGATINYDVTQNKYIISNVTQTNTTCNEYYSETQIEFTISYNLDGGNCSNCPLSYTIYTDTFTLSNPTKSGYKFEGWSGTGLSGSSNKTITIVKGSTGNRSYTANWSKNGCNSTRVIVAGANNWYGVYKNGEISECWWGNPNNGGVQCDGGMYGGQSLVRRCIESTSAWEGNTQYSCSGNSSGGENYGGGMSSTYTCP